jgi:hypothetical protein
MDADPNGTYINAFARECGTWAMKDATRSLHAAQRNAGTMLSHGADSRISLRFIRATFLDDLVTGVAAAVCLQLLAWFYGH